MEELIKAVKEHSGMSEDELKAVRNADDGYAGFTYYKDTCEFYENNAGIIWDKLCETAEELGEKPLEMIAHFGCVDSIVDDDTFKNALSWYALEEVARYLENKD